LQSKPQGRAKCSPFYYGGKEDLMDMATEADINIEHRLTEVEQRAKSNTNRLNEHDEILKSNSEMIGAIKELATEVKYMRGDLNETVERLNKLEGKDGDKWDKFKWLIVTGLVTLILGYLAVSVGLK
jgi:Flp pilus assembly protein TadB